MSEKKLLDKQLAAAKVRIKEKRNEADVISVCVCLSLERVCRRIYSKKEGNPVAHQRPSNNNE